MKNYFLRFIIAGILGVFFLLPISCAPGPPPPIFPGFWEFIFAWLMIIGILAFVFFLWKRCPRSPQNHEDYLTESLNAISKRLKALESKLEEMEQGRKTKKE